MDTLDPREQDPTIFYEMHKKEFEFGKKFRQLFLENLNQLRVIDVRDLETLRQKCEAMCNTVPGWFAMAIFHAQNLSPSSFTPEEMEEREKMFQSVWQGSKTCADKSKTPQEHFLYMVQRTQRAVPPIVTLMLLSCSPMKQEGVDEEKRQMLTRFGYNKLNEVYTLAEAGNNISGSEKKMTGMTTHPRKINEDSLRLSVGGQEIDIDTLALQRLLSRNGLLDYSNLLNPDEREKAAELIKRYLTAMLSSSFAREKATEVRDVRLDLHKKEGTNDSGVALNLELQVNSKNGKIVAGEFGINTIGEREEKVAPTMTCGWYRMPIDDIRLNVEFGNDSLADEDRLQKELEPVVEAITSGYLEGLPLSFKVTMSDASFNPSRGSGKRIIFYVDFTTCQRLIQLMKDKRCGAPNPRMIQDRDSGENNFVPFADKKIHVRASGEGISEAQKQLVSQQLANIKI